MRAKNVLNKVDFKKVRNWLGGRGKKLLLYHRDADGVCTAAVLMKFFHGFECMPREGPIIDRKFFEKMVSESPDLIVFLDIPVDQEWEKVLELGKKIPGVKIIIIDHHIPERDMNSESIVHINPRLSRRGKESYIPASCVIYQVLEEIGHEVTPHIWISLTGVIGDYGLKDCKWMVKECGKEYPGLSIPELSKAAEMISSAITLKGLKGAEKSLELLLKSGKYEDFESSRELRKWDEIVRGEKENILEDFEKKKEVNGKFIFYEIKSKLNITSVIATITAERYPKKVVVIMKKSRDGRKVSLRCQEGGINVGDLAKKATKGIGSGGGHTKSAGALVNDWNEFKKRALEYA